MIKPFPQLLSHLSHHFTQSFCYLSIFPLHYPTDKSLCIADSFPSFLQTVALIDYAVSVTFFISSTDFSSVSHILPTPAYFSDQVLLKHPQLDVPVNMLQHPIPNLNYPSTTLPSLPSPPLYPLPSSPPLENPH